MAKGYKVNEPIRIRIRCNGDPASDNPTVVIYDEVDGTFATLTLGTGLTQVGTTRIVKGEFTPDTVGEWSAHAIDDQGLDVVKTYSVGQYSIVSIGAKVATLEAKIDAQDVQIAANQLALTNAIDALGVVAAGGGGHFG